MFEAYYLSQRMPRLSLGLSPEVLKVASGSMPLLSLIGCMPPSMRLPPPSPLMQRNPAVKAALSGRSAGLMLRS